MKYDYSVVYNGKFYRAGEEVPVVTQEKTSEDSDEKITPENEGAGSEKTDGEEEADGEEETVPEVKKASKRRTKA